jgi:hypothetical protein
MKRLLVVAVLILATATAGAQPAADLAAAEDALAQGDYDQVIAHASRVTAQEAGAKADFAEAHRLLGLAYYFAGNTANAEAELLAYLRLDLDGRLDPSTVPPEAIAFFEDVRSRHAAELKKLRPRQRRFSILNLVPPGGQIQNRDAKKAWFVGGAELVLAATSVTTYMLLRSWCSNNDFTCHRGDDDVPDMARKLRTANYVSGAALILVYAYGVIDGYRGFNRHKRERQTTVTAVPTEGGMVAGLSMSF